MKARDAKRASLDPLHVELEGLNVIEANAGTGKTWTITALYVRLLLEKRCPVESILVVTFTEAATGELRDRIRRRLTEALAAFERGKAEEKDPFTRGLLERSSSREDALLTLTAALRNFDQAPIYTIHGFCQRVLADRAFESGMAFTTEIVPDPSAIVKEIAEDFWRNEVHAASALFSRYLLANCATPASLTKDVARYVGKPYLEVRACTSPPPIEPLEAEYELAYKTASALWLSQREAIEKKLIGNASLSGTSYREAWIRVWLQEMQVCLRAESPQLDLCGKFEKFTPDALTAGTKRGMTTPAHPFFDACGELKRAHSSLLDAYCRKLVLTKVRLLEFCNAELASRKERARLQSYDDLLINLHTAVNDAEKGERLVTALRERYQAALIDEFQDTDPIQYGIFSRIYSGTAQPVFLVGDPKQSIYSFRGADVFAYLEARNEARAAHTLATNWRSDASLLGAVNALFTNAANPFALGDIDFVESDAAAGDRGKLVIAGDSGAPFELWLLEGEAGKAINKGVANRTAAQATAAEIARLLNLGEKGKASIAEAGETRPLRGGDIAVLARSHRQAGAVRDALAALGVPSVQRGAQSVFSTREAEELERVLAAIAEPGRENLIGAALATEMIGFDADALYALQNDAAQWEQTLERFREAHRVWHEGGFMRMLRGFVGSFRVLERVLAFGDGERRATNLLHVAELLHCEASGQGMSGVLAWFAAKRRAPSEGNEAELLRLESDENLVKLLTVHAAKGLEFALVFCPFLWDGGLHSIKGDVLSFHDPESHAAVVDFGSAAKDAAREQAVLEERAESLRLLYVALTRAKYRCWMLWGNVNEAAQSAPAWLLHRAGARDGAASSVLAHLEAPQLNDMENDLRRFADRAGGSVRLSRVPAVPDALVLASSHPQNVSGPRSFTRPLKDMRQVTSFTALAHGRTVETPDYDAAEREPLPESVTGRDIFAFPRGAQAGQCVHIIFERIDFEHVARPELEHVVSRALAEHGFDEIWTRAVADMVQSTIQTPLDKAGMRLASVARSRRLDELEFYYPIEALTDAGLRDLLMEGGFPGEIRERIGALRFHPAAGYMKGFMDLVFEHAGRYYIVDYKTNWLGPTPGAYAAPELAKAMARDAYYLQYLVYTVALHRYLGRRVRDYRYEQHFGGIRYLFVRGMRPELGTACGVYSDRPSVELVLALDRYLATGQR